jgi:uncharacterized protein involved in response to NO
MLLAGVANLVRVIRWQPWRTLSEPLVWSLHATFLCIPVSLILRGLLDNPFAEHNMLHLFAIGGIGGVILAMIARVTMGHTGRAIYEGPSMVLAFALIVIAALVRGVGVAFFPQYMMLLIDISAGMWVIAFGLYVVKFGYMLVQARADGHPG